MNLTKAVGDHLPWVPAWIEGEYQPTEDEMDLALFVTREIVLQQLERNACRREKIRKGVSVLMAVSWTVFMIILIVSSI